MKRRSKKKNTFSCIRSHSNDLWWPKKKKTKYKPRQTSSTIAANSKLFIQLRCQQALDVVFNLFMNLSDEHRIGIKSFDLFAFVINQLIYSSHHWMYGTKDISFATHTVHISIIQMKNCSDVAVDQNSMKLNESRLSKLYSISWNYPKSFWQNNWQSCECHKMQIKKKGE